MEVLFSCLFLVKGEIPKSGFIVSPSFHDTDSLPCYVKCMLIKYSFTSLIT